MTRRTGLTTVGTVVLVVGILVGLVVLVALLVAILMPGLGRARELARRASCKSNLSNIGKGMAMYTASNGNEWPWLKSDNRWDAPTGAGRYMGPSPQTTYNVSALLFMLVRDGQSSGIFRCASDTGAKADPNTMDMAGGTAYNWDFSPYRMDSFEHVSYSYQAPVLDSDNVWGSGVPTSPDPNLAIVADKTPTYAGKAATFNWATPGKDDPQTGMSQNHSGGEVINVLYADIHVAEAPRADVGVGGDNIYSCADSKGKPPMPETNPGAGTLNISNHRSTKDSFLLGPTKMEK